MTGAAGESLGFIVFSVLVDTIGDRMEMQPSPAPTYIKPLILLYCQ